MKRLLTGIAFAAALAAAPMSAGAQAPAPIGVSYQPSLYWALPFHYANVKGWWKDVGLAPNFTTSRPARRRSRPRPRNRGTWAAPAPCRRCWARCASTS